MKKITLLLFLLNISFAVTAQTFNFDTDSEGWIGKNGALTVDNGVMTLTPDNHKNPNIQYKEGLDANANRYMHLKVKNNSSIANQIRFLVESSSSKNFINATMSQGDSDFQDYTLDLSEAALWTGTLDKITIRFTDDANKVDGAANSFEIDYIIFDNNATLKTESLEKFNFSFYPNPTQDKVVLSASEAVQQVQIYNLMGQEVLNLKLNNKLKPEINISNLSAGVYNMKVRIGDTEGVVKIVKK